MTSANDAATVKTMSGPTRETRLIDALVTLADTLVADYDLVELMQYLVEVSVDLLDAAAAGLLLADGDGHLDVLASTSERTELLEVLQLGTGRGPCVDCYTTGAPQTIRDVAAQTQRWPQFAPLALREGFRSVHAVPMRHRDRVIGALNLFRSQPGELAEPDRRAAQALADVATIGILQHRAARHTAEVNDQLRHALASRVVIEQAKGILAHYGRLDMDAAFTALRGHARRHHLRLTDLAQALVDRQRRPADILGVPAPAHPTTSRPQSPPPAAPGS
jgi:GAF domain-containing protein